MSTATLTRFIKALRGAGVPVSTAETLDAARVVEQIGFADRARLKTALAITLAKTWPDKLRFSQCFDDFFQFAASAAQPAPAAEPTAPPQGGAGDAGGGGSGAGGQGEQGEQGEPSALAQLLAQGDRAALEARMAQAMQAAKVWQIRVITQKGLFARRVMQAMGAQALDEELLALEQRGDPAAIPLRAARTALQQQVIEQVNREFLLQARAEGQGLRERAMREVNLRDLHEFRDVQALVQRMARRLMASHSRRQQTARRGTLDMRRTLTASVRHDGLPMRLHWKKTRRTRAQVFVICDVSSSVAAAARFLLLFLYAVNDVLPRVRSFAFASRFGEVSTFFDGSSGDATAAVDQVLAEYAGSGTDYAGMLEQFWCVNEAALNSQATVIILGDARNNNLPPGQQWLQRISERSRQVLWLNPEGRSRWGSGDSEMPAYLPYCRHALPCRNLAQLERFVDLLLKDLR